ncbi:MAG TPA: lysylphosphatidylglycerol synthase transmembrane domain-containing protein [Candidatus Limnocylindrales bacterium]|nr:lysylphosphatidylglycerol synthase transmembrane domain-containing protein [Candidatus Limnocylindrales bacterium]
MSSLDDEVSGPEPERPSSLRRAAGTAAKLLVSALALWVLWRAVESKDLFRVLASADPLLVGVVVVLYLIGQALTAYRWSVIAHRLGFRHRLREMTRYYFIGMFFNLFGVSTVGGDLVRSLYLGQRDNRRTLALHTVLFDRLSGLAMLVMVAVMALAVFGRFGLPWPLVALTAAAGAALTLGWWIVPPLARRVLPRGSRALRLIEEDLGPFWHDRELLIRAAWVSSGFHILQVLALILLGHAIHMQVDWRYYFVFHPLVTVLSAMPVSLAGLGIREMGYVWFLKRHGVPADTAFAFGLLWFFVLTVSSLTGGLVYLLSGTAVPLARNQGTAGRDAATASEP